MPALITPMAKKTAVRTTYLGLKNLYSFASGKMSYLEIKQRAKQTISATIGGELTLRQAAQKFTRTRPYSIPQKAFDSLVRSYHLQEDKQALFECLLLGGYEARNRAETFFRIVAQNTSIDSPTWQVEINRDLFLGVISKEEWSLINRVINIGQGEAVFEDWVSGTKDIKEKKLLLQQLKVLDDFIGIEKYAERVNFLIDIAEGKIEPPKLISMQAPPVTEVSDVATEQIPHIKEATLLALSRLDEITFGAVVGGSAERMKYVDAHGKPLPQATYPFLPISKGDIFKLHADEILALKNLYYLTRDSVKEDLDIPYFMMTSAVTDRKIMEDFRTNQYFGLGKNNVLRVIQTLVPVVSADGRWLRVDAYKLNTKPHGHGDFWTLYFNSAAQAKLAENMKNFTLIVQGNNPSVFAHALEFAGLGMLNAASFGLATCPRRAKAPEGSIVLTQNEAGQFSIRNIEYPIMSAFGLEDKANPKTGYSDFPGNLNFLFANNNAIFGLIEKNPFPGELINLAKPQDSYADGGKTKGGRGESQVQGIPGEITAQTLDDLSVFVMNAARGSDPSGHFDVFKNAPEKDLDTVATCRQNYSDRALARLMLAGVEAGRDLPTSSSVIELTPAFANRQDILNSKISGGRISESSTLYLSGFHANIRNMNVKGHLEIKVENEIGDAQLAKDSLGAIIPDPKRAGKYRIEGLKVINAGRKKVLDENGIWQGEFEEIEGCQITIKGNGELVIRPGIRIKGNLNLVVNDNEKVTLSPKEEGGYSITREQLTKPSWKYKVEINHSKDTLDLFDLIIE